jgi:hypothetical protein
MLKIVARGTGPALSAAGAGAARTAAAALLAAGTGLGRPRMIVARGARFGRPRLVVAGRTRFGRPAVVALAVPAIVRLGMVVPSGPAVAPGARIRAFRSGLAGAARMPGRGLRTIGARSGITMVRFGGVGRPGMTGGLTGWRHRGAQLRNQLSQHNF